MKKQRSTKTPHAWSYSRKKRVFSSSLDALDAEELRWMTSEIQTGDYVNDDDSEDPDDTDFGYLLQFDDKRLVDMIRAA